jgi:hypothetical protein
LKFPLQIRACLALATVGLAITGEAAAAAPTPAAVPRSPGKTYAAGALPDRIVLTPGANPARDMAVSYRTDRAQTAAQAQIVKAVDSPTLERGARTLSGTSTLAETTNGAANYHQVQFTGLNPDTVYAYRLKGSAGWSEWLQFRTAAEGFRPFRALYLADVQNGILPYASRVIRQAFHAGGDIALTIHTGDQVAQRDDLDHDDEWGEWSEAGGYNYAIVPQMPATGNHEYAKKDLQDGTEKVELGAYWARQFSLPGNGASGLEATTYYVDYQGVRFVVLDGTAAADLGKVAAQTEWLDRILAASKARWNVVVVHQPIFTCARPEDIPAIQNAWKPVIEKRKVDLVLQGHDHCYSRVTDPAGRAASNAARAAGKPQGPVYVVSVVGSKMYGLNNRATVQPDKAAADTQLYQLIDFGATTLRYRSYTATGRLYDAFDLERSASGANRLDVPNATTVPERFCSGSVGPDGAACLGRAK